MADQKQIFNSIVHRYKDLGDGSFAEVVALDGGVTISSVTVSDVEISNDMGNPIPITASTRVCVGRQNISVTAGSVSSLTVPGGAVACVIQADGSAVSIALDGTAPTSTSGLRIDDGVLFYVDTSLTAVRLIARAASTSVQVAYFNKA